MVRWLEVECVRFLTCVMYRVMDFSEYQTTNENIDIGYYGPVSSKLTGNILRVTTVSSTFSF